jgi:hypothetical protein
LAVKPAVQGLTRRVCRGLDLNSLSALADIMSPRLLKSREIVRLASPLTEVELQSII